MTYIPNQPISPNNKIQSVYWGKNNNENPFKEKEEKFFEHEKTDEFIYIEEVGVEFDEDIEEKSLLAVIIDFILSIFTLFVKLLGFREKED